MRIMRRKQETMKEDLTLAEVPNDTSIRLTKLRHESYPDIRYYLDWRQHCLARVLTPFIGLCPYAFWPLWRRLCCNEDVSEPGSGFVTSWRLMLHYTIIIINYICWPITRINTRMGWTASDQGAWRRDARQRRLLIHSEISSAGNCVA